MGILANTVSICQFRVAGDQPAIDLFQWVSEKLRGNGFTPIDQGTAELSVGWVHLDDHRDNSFASPSAFWRDHYLALTLRQDKRSIPAKLFRAHQQEAEQEFLAANPGYTRVPKQKREELKEIVKSSLLARTLPVPTTYDAVWDTRSNILTLTTLGTKAVELFETHFKKSFEGLRLVAVHPFDRAGRVVPEEFGEALAAANKATSEAVLDQIKSNQWLGWDFLLWLMYRTMNDSSEYRVNRPGPALDGATFVAYLNDRMVLCASGEEGVQKFTASGALDRFGELRTSLRGGKRITEAAIYLEHGEHVWKLTLKGEQFHFASFKSPQVKEERDNTVDELSEREAVFFERMYVLEFGLQLFDSLFATFLAMRLSPGWEEEMRRIDDWMNEG